MYRALRGLLIVTMCFGGSVFAHAETPRHFVFAHYMMTNQDYQGDSDPSQEKKIAAYEREIQEAQAIGIDGFALNVGGWFKEPYYIRYTAQMFEAAVRLHSGFKLMFSADMCCSNTVDDIEDMMRRFAGNPRYANVYFQSSGKFVLTTFAGDKFGPEAWVQMRIDLLRGLHPSTRVTANAIAPADAAPSNAPLRTFFVPSFFWGGEVPTAEAVQKNVKEWAPAVDGAFYWGIAGVPGSGGALDTTKSVAAYDKSLHAAGKLFMAPIALQFWGANANRYFEYSGAAGMRQLWKAAIENRADWVEIITWNDFIEGTYVSPINDPNRYPGANFLNSSGMPIDLQGYFPSHRGATELLRYFISWYKVGTAPSIVKDEVFYFYRTQSKNANVTTPSLQHSFGPVKDSIYVTANLIAPATLIIRMGESTITRELPAGSIDVEAPFVVGETPSFSLLRDGKVIASGKGGVEIQTMPTYRNYYYATGVFRGDGR